MKVDLLREKILPSLLKLAWPLMATSFVQVTYALVDMMWLGRLGTNAVAAAGTVGTYVWLINSIMLIPKIEFLRLNKRITSRLFLVLTSYICEK